MSSLWQQKYARAAQVTDLLHFDYQCAGHLHLAAMHSILTARLVLLQSGSKSTAILPVCNPVLLKEKGCSCRCHWSQVQQAIASFDPHVFSCLDDVVTVQKCLPTEEEQGLLESYVSSGASLDLLTDEEKFCILLMKVLPKGILSAAHFRARESPLGNFCEY